ncbi:MAG: glucose-1-phosphate adenylyltransferase subunit GlgD [Angelakisella sp.]|jgi:glucose-1-phosphate adenylyltransferase|nr:glucose-1-phosphate adenylyltransferase subunit GlgD [Angelakisella sp.]MCI9529562.1 glucose-1-phosphate adenylyltransferase subunit GlgD [Angelakisella sp.]
MSESKVLGIVFSNMHDDQMGDLTMVRTMGSVPFGGRYRLVDFALSNMVNAGIRDVGMITKSNYHSLMDHVGSGREWDLARKIGGLTILPPYARAKAGMYRGNLDALNGIYAFLASSKAKYVLLCDCDIVANIDYNAMLAAHEESGAGVTILCGRYDVAPHHGEDLILSIQENGFLRDAFQSAGVGGEQDVYMNAAIFDRELLLRLTADGVSHGQYSINGVISEQARSNNVYCYRCGGWSYHIHNLTEYFAANMALLDEKVRQELFLPERPILTKIRDEAPAKYGLSSSVKNSLVADGCIIEGTVENSVIFRGVKIGQGAVVKNSIIMQSTVVNNNAELEYVVLDKDVLIKDGRRLAGYLTYPLYVPKKSHI